MASGRPDSDKEIEFRRRWYEAHVYRLQSDLESGLYEDWLPQFRDSAPEALAIRDRLASSGDLDRFRAEQQTWAFKEQVGFKGHNGAQLINSLVKRTDDRAKLTDLLVGGLTPPTDRESAATKMDALLDHIDRIKVGAHPAPVHVAFMFPYFWALEQPHEWPVFWPSSRKFLEVSTGTRFSGSPTERYFEFIDLVAELDDDYEWFTRVTSWWDEGGSRRSVFLNPVLVDRCAYGRDPEVVPGELLESNAAALVGIARYLANTLAKDVSEVVEHLSKREAPRLEWRKGRPRSDLWADWRVQGFEMGLRLWINDQGAAIGISPGLITPGWTDEALDVVYQNTAEGFRMMGTRDSTHGDDVGFVGRTGSFIYGRWYEPDQLVDLDLRAEVVDVAVAARPLVEALISRASAETGKPQIPAKKDPKEPPVVDPLEEAALDLLVDRAFLDDIEELLKDKGQVILYGPPGTGKTYLAQKLAEALAPDPADRALVQFHPSTSYEDFFEGYRPEEGPGGQIVYRLTPGPLARMVERAMEQPQRCQMMIIDEINRANLPKVLGELLFLLEYRDKSISTLYRPEGKFKLPKLLWFIGTMNTADRSIALVDAALRRRFHFVPFFPDRGPTQGLLDRWLKRGEEPLWVDELVTKVNDELTEALGADLQLGASHFMKKGYGTEPSADDPVLRRIWRFNIEPFIEDQFFGNETQISKFRLGPVITRYRSSLGLDDLAVGPGAAGDEPDEQV
ncbi:MAG: AAA family ATPase [bacterium]|nr:AAA family ATPase [bacterium]